MRRRLAIGMAFGMLAMVSGHFAQAQAPQMGFFITSAGPGKGADLGGLSGADAHCQKLAAAAGAGGRTWRAYLTTTASGGQGCGQREGSDWLRTVGERQGCDRRDQRRRAAQRREQAVERELAHRKRRGRQRARRHAESSRHPDRNNARRHRIDGIGRLDVRKLDQQRRRKCAPRPSRPPGWRREPDVLELGPPVSRVQPGQPARHRRRWTVLLLRRELAGLPQAVEQQPEERDSARLAR